MKRDRLLPAGTILSSVAGVLSLLLGMGMGLAEQSGAVAFYAFGAVCIAAAVLCVIVRDRG